MTGAPTTLEALAERYDGKIRAFLKTVTAIGQDDLDDMVQDVYLRVHKYRLLERYAKDRSAFTSYLYLVCRSVARNQHRANQRRPLFIDRDALTFQRLATPARQEQDTYLQQLRDYLTEQPALQPIMERVDRTGRISKRDEATLLHALRPVLA